MSTIASSASILSSVDGTPSARRDPTPPQRREASVSWQDALFEKTTLFFALLVLALLAAIIASLVYGAIPALTTFGPKFLVTNVWNPVTHQFGALAPIYGTLVTSAIALLIGIPVSFGIALFLT
jgi:phosphate transport system permease protein